MDSNPSTFRPLNQDSGGIVWANTRVASSALDTVRLPFKVEFIHATKSRQFLSYNHNMCFRIYVPVETDDAIEKYSITDRVFEMRNRHLTHSLNLYIYLEIFTARRRLRKPCIEHVTIYVGENDR